MTTELSAQYEAAYKPFVEGGGCITDEQVRMRPMRVFLEINSACSLKCPTCTKGNMQGYEHQTGIMDDDLMQRIIDKIKSENPQARVMIYGNSEPFIHPRLAHCIASVKQRGLLCEFSTNLNHVAHVDEVLGARPDMIIISLSGFTQEVYVRGHAGGQIDKVKANMKIMAEANSKLETKVEIAVNYHIYDYNQHEVALMKEYAEGLGINFFTSIARAISMENAIQYCRSKDESATPYEVQEGRPDWNQALPPISQTYVDTMAHLLIPPTKAVEMYEKYPVAEVCPVGAGSMLTFIRHDGKTQMCACVADRRITLTDYLDATPDGLVVERQGHSICSQCMKYKLNYYFMIADREKWGPL